MAENFSASATSSAASGGAVPTDTPLRWLRPSIALLIGGVLATGTGLLAWWVTAADPDLDIPSLALAGSDERATEILREFNLSLDAARSTIARDVALIAAYVLTLVFWCAYGGLRARRTPTRRALMALAGIAVVAGVLDLIENGLLGSLLDGTTFPETLPSPEIDWLFGLALAKLVLLTAPVITSLAILLGTIGRVARSIWGAGARPVFLGSFRNLQEPTPPAQLLARRPVSYGAAQERRPPMDSNDETCSCGRCRSQADPRPPWPKTGICVSGGGIRAGSVALGALQSLIEADVYQHSRYLASVSGGGYVAGASQIVAWFDRDRKVVDGSPFDPNPVEGVLAPETAWMSTRARFLWPPVELGRVPSTRAFLSSSAFGLLGILFNVGLALALIYATVTPIGWFIEAIDSQGQVLRDNASAGAWISLAFIGLGLGPLLGAFFYGFLGRFEVADPKSGRRLRGTGPRIAISIVVALAGIAVVAALVRFGLPASAWWSDHPLWARPLFLLGGVVIAATLAYLIDRGFKGTPVTLMLVGLVVLAANWHEEAVEHGPDRETSWRPVLVVSVVLVGVAAFLIMAAISRLLVRRRNAVKFAIFVVLSFLIAVTAGVLFGYALVNAANDSELGPAWAVWLAVVALVAGVYALLDQKRWSPHPVYKRRLASTFSPVRSHRWDPERREEVGASQLPYSIRTRLSEWLTRVDGHHPELLVCAAVYDTRRAAGEVASFPFVFSRNYVGGADIGWARTIDFEAALGKANAGDGSLLAAMAISGAAVSAAFGQINLGTANIALALLNARLGVWLPSPAYVNELRNWNGTWTSSEGPALRWIRVRRATYLIKEVLGIHDRTDRFIYVTDGGQFDNLGLLELLSRRCQQVISIDASGDGILTTTAFDEVRQLALDRYRIRFSLPGQPPDPSDPATGPTVFERIEAGERVRIKEGKLTSDLCSAHGAAGLSSPMHLGLVERMARSSVAVLDIHYPDQVERGRLIFAKAVLTAATPNEVLSFALDSKRFPHNSTADQFLEADQVTNYIRLGRYLGAEAARKVQRGAGPLPVPNGDDPAPSDPDPKPRGLLRRRVRSLRVRRP